MDLTLYVFYLFFLLCVNSLSAFFSAWAFELVVFILFSKVLFFMLSRFSLTVIDSHATLHLLLGLAGLHWAIASICAVTNFTYLLFGVCFTDVS